MPANTLVREQNLDKNRFPVDSFDFHEPSAAFLQLNGDVGDNFL